ncbi:MAG: pseudouridine synthase [Fibrobacterota bacterium]
MTDDSMTEDTVSEDRLLRINRFLSQCGLGSRRECEGLVRHGVVTLNGTVVKDLATRVNPEKDTVLVRGTPVRLLDTQIYILLNKPTGVVVSRKGYSEKTVFDLLPGFPANLSYAGRLDADSEGLLLLTTNGELINRLAHPRYEMSKVYLVTLDRPLTKESIEKFRRGVALEDGTTLPAQIDRISPTAPDYRIILREGRNRQIRRMAEALGVRVVRLTRVAFGPFTLGNLKSGAFRHLSKNETGKLKRNLKLASI